MPFLLGSEPQPDGMTHATFDIGPTSRANVVIPTVNAHETLSTNPDALFATTLTEVRPPARTRRRTP